VRFLHLVADNPFVWTDEDDCGRVTQVERRLVCPRVDPAALVWHGIRTWFYVRWPRLFRQPILKVREA
jgi:hypothetical protein